MSIEQLEAEALQLPPDERERLAEKLIASLHDEVDDAIARAWMDEAHRRRDEIASGKVMPVPGDVVAKRALERLK
jgi:putative addiction module component (TIGR02574 family)